MFVHLHRQFVEHIVEFNIDPMNNSEINTEQIILDAAEAEFFEKGYGNAKMMAIAKRANVAHSMLHYYFRSKENLFQTIFLKKLRSLLPMLENVFEQKLPFYETIRILMETQFKSLTENSKLTLFLLTEILGNEGNRAVLSTALSQSAIIYPLSKLKEMLDEEVKKGTVRPIQFHDFMMLIMSINASAFFVMPVLQNMDAPIEDLLAQRCESNVQFVLAALQP